MLPFENKLKESQPAIENLFWTNDVDDEVPYVNLINGQQWKVIKYILTRTYIVPGPELPQQYAYLVVPEVEKENNFLQVH